MCSMRTLYVIRSGFTVLTTRGGRYEFCVDLGLLLRRFVRSGNIIQPAEKVLR